MLESPHRAPVHPQEFFQAHPITGRGHRDTIHAQLHCCSSIFSAMIDCVCHFWCSVALPLSPYCCSPVCFYCVMMPVSIVCSHPISVNTLPTNDALCVMSSHKPKIIYMGGLILGINTLYRLFCFLSCFLWSVKG